jgi:AGCS family alanine or glycine:cation symporter
VPPIGTVERMSLVPQGEAELGGIGQAIDGVFGFGVEALEAVLFTPLFAGSESASSVELVDEVEELEALVLELERDGLAVENASLTLTVPASAISEAQASILQQEFEAAVVPTAPKGTRKFELVRSEDAT